MSRDVRVYLEDILESIRRITEYTQGLDEQSFRADALRQDAVVRNLEVLGEAVKQISDDVRSRNPDVEWHKIAGLRDILIHQYFGLDVGIIWDVVRNKLPDLERRVRDILTKLGRSDEAR